jgi:hypothetical protein
MMRPITTLLDRENTLEHAVLPDSLAILYGGDLRFPEHEDRPYVVGNFVSTLDGVVTFEVPGKSGGGDISGFRRESPTLDIAGSSSISPSRH